MPRPLVAALALVALSCARKSIDLQAAPHVTPDPDPTVIGTIDEQVGQLEVDDERLYWMGSQGQYTTAGGSALRSCKKRDCAATLVTYDADEAEPAAGFGIAKGQIYWFHFLGDQPEHWDVRACDVSGCAIGSRTVVAEVSALQLTVAAYDSDALYLFPYRIPLAGDAIPLALTTTVGWPGAIGVHEGFLYWVEQSQAGRTALGELRRVRTDGSSAPETLTDHVKIAPYAFANTPNRYFASQLAFDSAYVYWTQGTLDGAIQRCPLAGCSGEPEVVAAPIRTPLTLRIDGSKIYWLHDSDSQGFQVSNCEIGNCTLSAPLVSGVDAVNALAVDDQYLYTASTEHGLDPNLSWTNPIAKIRRIAK